MAEAYYASIAPHNPLGPISLASGVQIAASIPNFLIQEQVSLGETAVPEYEYKNTDEIGSLSKSFNRMRRSLEKAMQMIGDQ